jgi:hypothetical protein
MTQAAARARAERINFHIIATCAELRALIGVSMSERAPAGAARSAMELAQLTETLPLQAHGAKPQVVEVTRPGFHTARRRLPAVLSRMDERDARQIAAERYALAAEKVGSVAGASAEGAKTDSGAATNDGGVTTRILHAGTISAVEAVLARAGAALEPGRNDPGSYRRAISARELMDAVCLEDMVRAIGLIAPDAVRPGECA